MTTVDNPLDYAALLRSARLWACQGGAPLDDAEDVAQEATLRLWRADARGATWPTPAARYAYLHRVVRTILIDRAKSSHGRAAWCALDPRIPDGAAEGAALRRIELAAALRCLRDLGRNGQAVAMHAAGYRTAEIAAALGIAYRTADQALADARKRLQEQPHAHAAD